MQFDILIRNGSVLDGTGAESRRADVAVKGDRIIDVGAIPSSAPAKQIIDAEGMVVSPGFIDVHTHADFVLASPEHHTLMEPFIRQGITTVVAGNCGFSPAPIKKEFINDLAAYWDCMLPRGGLDWNWQSMSEFLARLETEGLALNVGQLVGHGNVRINTMGYSRRAPSPEELRIMREQVSQAMEEGALGLSFGLGYVPGVWADTSELIEIAKDLAPHGRITVHMRNQRAFIEDSVREMIHVAEEVGVPLQISHFVPFGLEYVEHFFRAYAATEEARSRGVPIGYDILPFAVESTTILILYPPWMFDGGMSAFLNRLRQPAVRARLPVEFREEPKWRSWETGKSPNYKFNEEVGWSQHHLWGFRKSEYQKYEGLNLEAIAEDMAKDPFEALFDLTLDEGGRLYFTAGLHDNEEMDMALGMVLRLPHTSFMTDAVGIGHHAKHPSHYGSFPRFMGKHVREWETFTLAEAVRKCTSQPAEQIGLPNRGMLRAGAYADIVIFNPKTVNERASFAKPYQYPDGIETVIINGVPVWHDGRYNPSAHAGQVIKA